MSSTSSARMACNLCRHRKIRCDKAKPACETCHLAGVPCVFTPLPQKKSTGEQLEESRLRTQQLEDALRRREQQAFSTPSVIPSLFEPSGFEASLTAFQWHLQYCAPGVAPKSQLASIFDFDAFAGQLRASLPPTTTPKPATIVPEWPSVFIIRRAIDHFARNGLYAVFPVVEYDVLTLLLNTHIASTEPCDAANMACLIAFTAFITRVGHLEPAFEDASPDAYLQAALSLVPQLLVQHTNIRALEALLIMALYIAPLGQPQSAELLLSMAVRILYNLGAHANAGPSSNTQSHEHLRVLFWLCYSVDKEMSLRKCQAPLIHDADCDLDLPAGYVPISSDHQFFAIMQSDKRILFPSDLQLVLFKSRVYHQLYSHRSLAHPEAIRLRLIRELDQELDGLKSQFPPGCQPERFVSTDMPDAAFRDLSLRGVNIHLEYYHCLTKIHGASLVGHHAATSQLVPSSSLELCYQAARSTLLYLGRVQHLINAKTFWIYAQFLLTAVLALYRRLVTHPGDSNSLEDLRILESILDMFVQLKESDPSHSFPPFAITESLIRHLIYLALTPR